MFLKELESIEKQIESLQSQRVLLLQQEAKIDSVNDYVFQDSEGEEVLLSSLFKEKNTLIMVHNMGSGCSYCTLWADGFNGIVNHLNDAFSFVVVSPDDVETMTDFAKSRDWKFKMISTNGTSFFEEMGFANMREGKLYYTPGYSVFKKNEDGTISRVSMDYFGPMDSYSSIWHIINFIPNFGKWYPKKVY
jgi:predicted dithiol-disulfide oxidoreductase (DUF899 family)